VRDFKALTCPITVGLFCVITFIFALQPAFAIADVVLNLR